MTVLGACLFYLGILCGLVGLLLDGEPFWFNVTVFGLVLACISLGLAMMHVGASA